jgi:N-acetylglutamate synthase-like GNAT family acetyltransferase
MIPHLHIKPAEIYNAKLLANIIRASNMDVAEKFNLTLENCPKHPSNCSVDWIKKDFDKKLKYYILEYSGLPKGCVALEQINHEICYLERLSVLREYRHHGFGRKLVDHVIEAAKDLGVKTIKIGTIADFTILNNWYKTLGFIEEEIKEFQHLPFKVLMMSYKLK